MKRSCKIKGINFTTNLGVRSIRKIVFYGAISLDGFLADEQDNLQWLFDTDLDGVSTYEEFEKEIDTVVMGRITYDETLKILADEPFYSGREKIIFSRSKVGKIPEVRYISENPVTLLSKLRKKNREVDLDSRRWRTVY